MRWYRFGTDFFVCDCEKRKMYWMYIQFFGKKQAGKDVPPNQSAVPKSNLPLRGIRVAYFPPRNTQPFRMRMDGWSPSTQVRDRV